jgi:F-type H+-transporting ATPase subunit alpha
VLVIFIATNGYLDDVAVADVRRFESEMYQFFDTNYSGVFAKIAQKKVLDDEIKSMIADAMKAFKEKFVPTPKAN